MGINRVGNKCKFCFVSEELIMSKSYCIHTGFLFKDRSTPNKISESTETLKYIKR